MLIRYRTGATANSVIVLAISLAIIEALGACSARHVPARCSFADFAIGAPHMTNTIASPFVVRELKGRFVPTFTPAENWAGTPNLMRMQLNGPSGLVREVTIAPDGTFDVPGLPAGTYCFHTSSMYFQGYDGTVIIDQNAPAGQVVLIHVDNGA
jgi:hypothetical protein